MNKPPVNIEWYDDGFSIEEQAELRRAYRMEQRNKQLHIKVTDNYHEKTKDNIISKLRQKLSANEEYIAELEEGVKTNKEIENLKLELLAEQEQNHKLKEQYTKLNIKYQELLHNPDGRIQKYVDTIKDLEKQLKSLMKIRDELIYKLNG